MSEISMQGTGGVECVTMLLDSATKTKIGTAYDSAKGKAVALTGNNTVGYGTDGDAIFGVIRKAESDGVATIQVKGFACGLAGTASATAINKYAAVDGSGGVKSMADKGISRGFITAVDDSYKTDILM